MSDEELLLAEDEAKWQSKQAKRLARERAEMQPVVLAGQHLQGRACPLPACLVQLSVHARDGLHSKDRRVSSPYCKLMLPGQAGFEVLLWLCQPWGCSPPAPLAQLRTGGLLVM